jgi:polysaccharide deacetylase family protein (PEP-CTERM system associated)
MINAMSIDIEDWFQVGAFENVIARESWATLPSRVERNSDAVLELFAESNVKATFFTLGWVAERFPALIRRFADAGHELASHGSNHDRVFTMTPEAFRADISRARKAIEDASGQRIHGYRAPSFSIDARNPWAHAVLAEEGYGYSSSVAPIAHDHYGWREAPRFAFRPLPDADLIELPVTTVELGGRRMAAGGGGFFRILPYSFSHWAIGRVNREEGRPAAFYFHPWEIDPEQPRIPAAPLRSRVRHYTRLSAMYPKLQKLLGDFSWGTTGAVVASERERLQ